MTEIERYWHGKEFKKWVVYISKTRHGKTQRDTLYVRAKNYKSACESGLKNTMISGPKTALARLAGPADLGCDSTMNNIQNTAI